MQAFGRFLKSFARLFPTPIRRRRTLRPPLSAESLESRQLLAATVQQFAGSGTGLHGFQLVGDSYFVAQNNQLATSDGRVAGIKPINLDRTGVGQSQLTSFGGRLVYTADGEKGIELWVSDGTAAGTKVVKDINPGALHSSPQNLTEVNGTLFFEAVTQANGFELWKTDGTESGTVLVKDINPGPDNAHISGLTNIGGTLYFSASNGTQGIELWKSDGTAAGTTQVRDIAPGAADASPFGFMNINGSLVFSASPSGVRGIWRTDGTTAGTTVLREFSQSTQRLASELANVAGTLYFVIEDVQTQQHELWKSDGTIAGTIAVTNIGSRLLSGGHELTNFDGTLIFKALHPTTGLEVWKSDGTAAGTQVVTEASNPGQFSGVLPDSQLAAYRGKFYYRFRDPGNITGLAESDGTPAGTTRIPLPGVPEPYPQFRTVDGVYFASFGAVWVIRDSAPPTITGPPAVNTSARPVISWTALPGATRYEVAVSHLDTRQGDFIREFVTGTSLTSPIDFGLGVYTIQVRALDANGPLSGWSNGYTVRSSRRVTTLPGPRVQSTNSFQLQIQPLAGAARYDVWLDDVTNQTTISAGGHGYDFTAPGTLTFGSLPMGVYKTWIRGIARSGIIGLYSSAVEFVIAPSPEVVTPVGQFFSRAPKFSWKPVDGAISYELTLKDANTGRVVQLVKNLTATSWTPPTDLAIGPYRWWVSAVSKDGYRSAAPPVQNLFVGAKATLLTPTGTTSDRTPTFTWSPVQGAAVYRLAVDRLGADGGRVIDVTSLVAVSEYVPTNSLAPGRYRAWIRAVGTFGELGLWSDPLEFRVT